MISSDLERSLEQNTKSQIETGPSPIMINPGDPQSLDDHIKPNPSMLATFGAAAGEQVKKLYDASVAAYQDHIQGRDTDYNAMRDPLLNSQGKDYMDNNAEYFKDSPNAATTQDRIKYLQDQSWLNENLAVHPIATTLGSIAGAAAPFALLGPVTGAMSILSDASVGGRLISGIAGGAGISAMYGAADLQLNPSYSKNDLMKETLAGAILGGVLTGLPEAYSMAKSVRSDLQKTMVSDGAGYKDNPFVQDAQQYKEFGESTAGAAQNPDVFRGYDLSDAYKIDLSNPVSFLVGKFAKIFQPSVAAADSSVPGVPDVGQRIFGSYWHTKGENSGINPQFSIWETRDTHNVADMYDIGNSAKAVFDRHIKDGGKGDIDAVINDMNKNYIENEGDISYAKTPAEKMFFQNQQAFFGKKNVQSQEAGIMPKLWKIKDEDGVERIINENEFDKLSPNEDHIVEPFTSGNAGYSPRIPDGEKILLEPENARLAMQSALMAKNTELQVPEAKAIAKEYVDHFLTGDSNQSHFFQTGIVKSPNLKARSLDFDPKLFSPYLKTNYYDNMTKYSKSINKDLSLQKTLGTTDLDKALKDIGGLYNDHAAANPLKKDDILNEKESMLSKFRTELGRFTGKDKSLIADYSPFVKGIETLKELQNAALMGHHGAWRGLDVLSSKIQAMMTFRYGDLFEKLPAIYKNAGLSEADLNFTHLAQECKMAGEASNMGGLDLHVLEGQGTFAKVASKANTGVNIVNGMSPMTNLGHRWTGPAVQQFILGASKVISNRDLDPLTGFVKSTDFAKEPPAFWEKELLRMGINNRDAVEIAKEYEKHALTDETKPGRTYLNIGKWSDNAQLKMTSALKKEMNALITTPTSGEKPAWMRTPVGSLATQFWGYQMSVLQKRTIKTAQELYGQGGTASMVAHARLVGSMANAAMMVCAVDAISGKDINKLTGNEIMAKAVQYGGILPVLDTFGNIADRHGLGPSAVFGNSEPHFNSTGPQDIVGALMGPTASMANDFYTAFQHTMTGQGSQKDLRYVLPHMPLFNLLYWNNMTNKLIYPDS